MCIIIIIIFANILNFRKPATFISLIWYTCTATDIHLWYGGVEPAIYLYFVLIYVAVVLFYFFSFVLCIILRYFCCAVSLFGRLVVDYAG